MTRLSIRFAIYRHKVLMFCSKSYREHDTIVMDRERWRRESVDSGNKASDLRGQLRVAEAETVNLRDRLKLAIEAQQKATEQLIAERTLRQSAEERADRYHGELTDSLKSNVDWLARGLYHRRPMFGVGAPPDEPQESKPPVQVPGKRMAREAAQNITNDTLREMLKDIRAGEVPAGPEFATQ